MSEFMPQFTPVVVFLFLGAILLLGVSVLALFYGAVRGSSFFTRVGAGAILIVAAGYFVLLGGVSFASSEKVLPPGGWKYFCEIDCHLAYSVSGVEKMAVLGPEMQQVSAHGEFIVVQVKTWFDERTISAHRGDGPLTPNNRKVILVDDTERRFATSREGQATFDRFIETSTPLTRPLRPGESYTTDLVFDVPNDAHGVRLLIAEDDPESRLVIGHENSLWHKKIYLAVDCAPSLTRTAR